jgi:hypothetical protein
VLVAARKAPDSQDTPAMRETWSIAYTYTNSKDKRRPATLICSLPKEGNHIVIDLLEPHHTGFRPLASARAL